MRREAILAGVVSPEPACSVRAVDFFCSAKMEKTAVTDGNGVRAQATDRSFLMGPHRSSVPPHVRRILIVGAGGFGREVLLWARDAWPQGGSKIVGFLAADSGRLDRNPPPLPIIADPAEYHPDPHDGLLLAIGIPHIRRFVAEMLSNRGASFLTLIHGSALVAPTATVGVGALICPNVIVSDAATIGDYALLNYFSSVGHDASVGSFAVLSPYAALGGGAAIEDDVFMGLHASVGPGKRVGSRSKLSANSCALADAPCDSLIYGAPGRIAPLVSLRKTAP